MSLQKFSKKKKKREKGELLIISNVFSLHNILCTLQGNIIFKNFISRETVNNKL
jgi:hypothetical protein